MVNCGYHVLTIVAMVCVFWLKNAWWLIWMKRLKVQHCTKAVKWVTLCSDQLRASPLSHSRRPEGSWLITSWERGADRYHKLCAGVREDSKTLQRAKRQWGGSRSERRQLHDCTHAHHYQYSRRNRCSSSQGLTERKKEIGWCTLIQIHSPFLKRVVQ